MSIQKKNAFVPNIKKENIQIEIKEKEKEKSKTKIAGQNKLNTKDIFGNKSENKIKTTTSKFSEQKS